MSTPLTVLFCTPTLALSICALLALSGCKTEPANTALDKTPAARQQNALPIRVSTVGAGSVIETLGVQGRLDVWQRLIVSPKIAGVVESISTQQNQEIKPGDVIIRLQSSLSDEENALRAKSKLTRAKRDLERLLKLRESAPETVSILDVDQARDAVTDSELDVAVYQQRADNRTVLAPFAGVLLLPPSNAAANTQIVTPGQHINEGFQVGELLDLSRYRLMLDLPETNLRRLALGQEVDITALADGVTAKGKIYSLPDAIDATKGSGRVLVDITSPPPSWRPGGFVTAQLVLGETKADLVVARDAVLYRENRPYVWVAEEHDETLVVRRAWIEVGVGDARQLIITKGVNRGDRIVTEGMSGLSDGVPVTIRDQQNATPAAASTTAAPSTTK
jgi:membrane fusion protein, multidrug efflux system